MIETSRCKKTNFLKIDTKKYSKRKSKTSKTDTKIIYINKEKILFI
jgi:hypothetical protein